MEDEGAVGVSRDSMAIIKRIVGCVKRSAHFFI